MATIVSPHRRLLGAQITEGTEVTEDHGTRITQDYGTRITRISYTWAGDQEALSGFVQMADMDALFEYLGQTLAGGYLIYLGLLALLGLAGFHAGVLATLLYLRRRQGFRVACCPWSSSTGSSTH